MRGSNGRGGSLPGPPPKNFPEILKKLWSAEGRRIDHHGKYYQFEDIQITPSPVQKPMSAYVASFSKPSIELAGRLGYGIIVAPFAAVMTFGGLADVMREGKPAAPAHWRPQERKLGPARRADCAWLVDDRLA